MKSVKSILLVLAGVLVTIVMFSFKNEETKKETCRLSYKPSSKKPIELVYEDRIDYIETNKTSQEAIKQLNKMTSDGWRITSTTSVWGSASMPYDMDVIYLERTKP